MNSQTKAGGIFLLLAGLISGLLMLSSALLITQTTNAYASHNPFAIDKNQPQYCIDYRQDHGGNVYTTGAQCEPSKKACDQRLAEYEAREDIDVIDGSCYRADIQKLDTVYCIDYRQDHGDGVFTTGQQCETSREACEARNIEYQNREDIEVLDGSCYKHEKQYINTETSPPFS